MATSDRFSANASYLPSLKLNFRDDIRRWTPMVPLTFDMLVGKILQLYGLPAATAVRIRFLDPEGDKVTLASDQDLAELLLLRIPAPKIFADLSGSSLVNKRVGAPNDFKHLASVTSDSEKEDGLWTPARLDKFLAGLTKYLASVVPARPGAFLLAKRLTKGSGKTDENGKQRIIASIQKSASDNPAAKKALCILASMVPESAKNKHDAPAAARALALKALGMSKENFAATIDISDDGRSWLPERLDKFLASLSQRLSVLTRDKSSVVHLVRMLTRGGKNADETGRERIVSILRRSLDQGSPLIAEVMTALAFNPAALGLGRPHIPGRALAIKSLGGNVSELPRFEIFYGDKSRSYCGRGKKGPWQPMDRPKSPHNRLVCNVTVPDETRVAPGHRFIKIWRVANSGELSWDPKGHGLVLLHVAGDALGAKASTPQCTNNAPPAPGDTMDLEVEMTAPDASGRYEGFFRLARLPSVKNHEKPMRFGQRFRVRIVVVEGSVGDVLPVMKGMSRLSVLPAHSLPAPHDAVIHDAENTCHNA